MAETTVRLEYTLPASLLALFQSQAEQKIQAEGWGKDGRPVEIKVHNFVQCWATEEAFKQILMQKKIKFRYRGLYFGDAAGAGADFTVSIAGKEVSLGIRSLTADSFHKWKSVAYPEDRFQHQQESIAAYHVACTLEHHTVGFIGIISKAGLLQALQESEIKYSPKNQEQFRVIPLEKFCLQELYALLSKMDTI